MPIKFSRLVITPTLAKKMLEQNTAHNRKLKLAKIPSYARDMKEGNWNSDTGETIKFAEDGALLDGQNRLSAVILAGVPITFDVAYNVPREAMYVIDTGAARSFSDTLKIANGGYDHSSAAVVRWHLFWQKKLYLGRGGGYSPTHTELLGAFSHDPSGYEAAGRMGRDASRQKLGPGSAFGIGFFLFEKINHEDAYNWQKHLTTGADLSTNHPALVLRNKLFRAKSDAISRGKRARYLPLEILAMNIRAWNHFRRDETVTTLTATGQSGSILTNENFPQPK